MTTDTFTARTLLAKLCSANPLIEGLCRKNVHLTKALAALIRVPGPCRPASLLAAATVARDRAGQRDGGPLAELHTAIRDAIDIAEIGSLEFDADVDEDHVAALLGPWALSRSGDPLAFLAEFEG
jgi:hypothetical protein